MMVKVLDDGDESEAFPVTNGVKQVCSCPKSDQYGLFTHADRCLP